MIHLSNLQNLQGWYAGFRSRGKLHVFLPFLLAERTFYFFGILLFLFAFPEQEARPTFGLLLKERICSYGSKFFSLRALSREAKIKISKLLYLKKHWMNTLNRCIIMMIVCSHILSFCFYLHVLCYTATPGYLCIYKVCYEEKKSPSSQMTVIVVKQFVLVAIQIYWFRPENNVLLMLINNHFARNGCLTKYC